METRIVTLSPTGEATLSTQPLDFEDAFGEFEEYSEARGRGRARRHERRMDRIAKRRERKTARIQARDDVRSARKQKRIARKSEAQRARQEKRQAAMERRQTRKLTRKEMRLKRKALGEPEAEMDEQTSIEMEEQQPEQQGGGSTPRYIPQTDDTGSDDSSNDTQQGGGGTGGYSDTIYAEDEQPAPFENEYSEDETPEYMGDAIDETGEGDGDEVYAEDESGFSGELGKKTDNRILEIAKKIEWNKELVLRLEVKKLKLAKALKSIPVGAKADKIINELGKIETEIAKRKERIKQLENELMSISNFSGADGIRKAKKQARIERSRISVARKRKKPVSNGGDVTPVDSDLNPDIAQNYIRVPNKMSNFEGRGIIALDDMNAYDADEPKVVELKSSADGSTLGKGIDVKKLLLVGATGFLLYHFVKFLTKQTK